MVGNLLMSISQDERERAVFRRRRMYQTDFQSNLATAEDRGERRGVLKGRAEGMIEVARNALRMDMFIEDIIGLTDLTHEDVEKIQL